jgi:murein DD-endopeptidase MepM/ murein hydrolase activator NlpD
MKNGDRIRCHIGEKTICNEAIQGWDFELIVLHWFPEREVYLRSRGRVRFVRISPMVQLVLAAALLAGFGLWLATSLSALIEHGRLDAERERLDRQAAQIEREDRNLQRNRRQLDQRTRTLESRQKQLEGIVQHYLGIEFSRPATAKPDRQSSIAPIDARLAAIERRQLGFASAVTRSTSAEQARHSATFRRLGLRMPASLRTGDDARGGPFIPYDGPEPQASGQSPAALFAGLQYALGQWQASKGFLAALPVGRPVGLLDMSSPFGVRFDPFTRRPAVHPGQDFRGGYGEPILAAGVGRITHAGRLAGYGNAVVVDHGFHLISLYGHMSRILVHDGQTVRRGEPLGLIGSTGRSTGPHLHFEVRLDGRSINPRPLMEMNLVR